MEITPTDLSAHEAYKFLIGSILPRPIAWVSTCDTEGVHNLAPFSYFTGICANPMTLLFCPGVHPDRPDGKKDTLGNIEETREFVINLTDENTAEAMNRSATELDADISEFEFANVTPARSQIVAPPRVAESPISFECALNQIVVISDQPGGGAAVIGTVKHVHIRDDLYNDGRIDIAKYNPIGRLGGNYYTRMGELFEMKRLRPPEH